MEISLVDPTFLPTEFKQMQTTSLNILEMVRILYAGYRGNDKAVIPLDLRLEYNEIFNAHFGLLSTSDKFSKSEKNSSFEMTKNRFNIFDVVGIKSAVGVDNKFGLMAELAQTVLLCVTKSYNLTKKDGRFRYISKANFREANKSVVFEYSHLLKALRFALEYARYKDGSLQKRLVPYMSIYGFKEQESFAKPDTGDSFSRAETLKLLFEDEFMRLEICHKNALDKSRYIDPDNIEYKDIFRGHYISAGITFVNYPMVYEGKEEMSTA